MALSCVLEAGEQLVDAAADSGDLVLGAPISAAQFNHFQPHQVRKKQRLSARFAGLAQAGLPPIETPGLRIEDLGQQLSPADREAEIAGTVRRVAAGKVTEEAP